jgi:hypothetical protein
VAVKYGNQWGGWCSNEVFGIYRVGHKKFIRRGWEEFFGFTRFKVGDNSKISFWHAVQCGEHPLKAAFPKLYSTACLRDASVANHL